MLPSGLASIVDTAAEEIKSLRERELTAIDLDDLDVRISLVRGQAYQRFLKWMIENDCHERNFKYYAYSALYLETL